MLAICMAVFKQDKVAYHHSEGRDKFLIENVSYKF